MEKPGRLPCHQTSIPNLLGRGRPPGEQISHHQKRFFKGFFTQKVKQISIVTPAQEKMEKKTN
jgi:hypothetical protein